MTQVVNLLDPKIRANPYPFYAELRRQRVCKVEPAGMWAVGRYDDIVAVMKDTKNFSSAAWADQMQPPWLQHNPLAKSLGVQDPPVHTRVRALVNYAFTPSAIARMERWVLPIAERLAEEALRRGRIEYVMDFATPMAGGVIGNLLGLDESLYPKMKEWASDLTNLPTGNHTPAQIAQTRQTVTDMQSYLTSVIESRRKQPRADLVTDLLEARAEGEGLSDEEIVNTLFVLVAAGFDTTITLLSNIMMILAQFPQVFERVRTNLELLPQLVEEVLRYEPPGHYIYRRALQNTEIGGRPIPQGALVVLVNASALRDEEHVSEPDTFNLDRKERAAVAFGHGVHYCLGSSLAKMQSRLATKALLQRIRGFTLEQDGIEWTMNIGNRGPVALQMRLHPL